MLNFGHSSEARAHRFTIYIPDRDKFGNPIDNVSTWVQEAFLLLTAINGGASIAAPSTGCWYSDALNGVITETTHTVYSLCDMTRFPNSLDMIRDFVCRFGLITKQACVAVQFDDTMYFVTEFSRILDHGVFDDLL